MLKQKKYLIVFLYFLLIIILSFIGCKNMNNKTIDKLPAMKEPLITHIYTADPSAHVFEDKIYIYPSHDIENDIPFSNDGAQFDMRDYHVFSMENLESPVIDHGEVLNINDIPWVKKQLWAPDAAFKNNTYYLYFPAKDDNGIFHIGVAISDKPSGPFIPQPEPIPGSYSIDPTVFIDDDNQAYMYFGGIWGGQLEKWITGSFNKDAKGPIESEPALGPKVVKMADNMLEFDGEIQEIKILDENKNTITAADNNRRFFEAVWVHKYNGLYYLSYSTGDTHYIVYATSNNPTGPFIFRGKILEPVTGWTTHHSIVKFKGKWYLFYHDSTLSGGITHLRNIKYAELNHNPDGTIKTINPYK